MPKPGIDPVVWQPPRAPARAKRKRGEQPVALTVYDLPGAGPEDVAIDSTGRVLAGLKDGRILRISPDCRHVETVAETGGRPLGIEIDPDGDLLVCDARLGVLRVNPDRGAVHSLVDHIGGAPMMFCNNGALGADGTAYFTDSSQHFGVDHYKGELLAHSGTGRLFRRTPDGSVDLVADGFQFANGVALAPDESWIAVAETGGYCLDKIWLTGPRSGHRDTLVENLPAFPDNISTGSDGLIWVALPSPRDPILDLLLPRAPVLRKVAWALPDALQPREKKTVWVQAYDADGTLVHDLQTTHERFYMATGVRELDGVVWLGSLTAPAIARIDVSARDLHTPGAS
ncbi:MAG: strictosidine synthase [Pseudonocardiales bacterium]|nr:strictosidine synthase [Pseudonocardiales bacterium]